MLISSIFLSNQTDGYGKQENPRNGMVLQMYQSETQWKSKHEKELKINIQHVRWMRWVERDDCTWTER